MKFYILSTLVISVLLFGSAWAENESSPNSFRLSFDLESGQMYGETAGSGLIDLYLTLNNTTVAEIYGWESSIEILGQAFVTDVNFPNGGVNEGTNQSFRVSYPDPLQCEPTNHLATISIFSYPGSYANCIGIFGDYPSESETGLAIKISSEEFSDVLARVYNNSQIGAQLNGEIPLIGNPWVCQDVVPNEPTSWDAIKSCYR